MNPPNKRSTRRQRLGAKTQSARELLTGLHHDPNGGVNQLNDVETWARSIDRSGDGRVIDTARCVGVARPEIAQRIAQMHNHKGHLSVVWNAPADDDDRDFIARMWALVANENHEMIDHFETRWVAGYGFTKEAP